MRTETLPHKVIPSFFCPSQALRIHTPSSHTQLLTIQDTLSYSSSVKFIPELIPTGVIILTFPPIFLSLRIFQAGSPFFGYSVKDFVPPGCLRSMGSGPGYPSARAWARECEAKRHPNAGTKTFTTKDPVFTPKSCSN